MLSHFAAVNINTDTLDPFKACRVLLLIKIVVHAH